MAEIIYLMKKNITNQQKSRVLLMLTIYGSNGDEDNKLALYEYFDINKLYLKDMIDDYQTKGEWKIQLSMQIIFVSFTDANETQTIYLQSDNDRY